MREPTFPVEAGALKKGGFVVLNARACRIVALDTFCPGKHGGAKVAVVGRDLFNGRKYEHLSPAHATVPCPVIDRVELLATAVSDRRIAALDERGNARAVGTAPTAEARAADAEALEADVAARLARGEDVFVSVVRAMDEVAISGVRSATDGGKLAREYNKLARGGAGGASKGDDEDDQATVPLSKKAARQLKKKAKAGAVEAK